VIPGERPTQLFGELGDLGGERVGDPIGAMTIRKRDEHDVDRVEKQSMPTQSLDACVLTQRAASSPRPHTADPATTASVVASRRVDQALLAAFRRGEAGGIRALYREYGRLVYSVAHRVLGRHELAEEAAQQTFVPAWQAANRTDVDRDPAPWLATIAKRTAIDVYRREARRPASALNHVAADDPALVSLPPEIDALDAIWHVRRAIDTLPRDEATIVRGKHALAPVR
jgi:RNA polymerase sigma factor (sigma-70 family)